MNIFDDRPGIDQLRAMMATGQGPSIGATLHFRLEEVEEGRVVFTGHPGPHATNPIGTVHGGFAATLLDSACGCAVHSRLSATQGYTTLELKVAYHRPLSADSGPVRAIGELLSFGRRAAFAEARLIDERDRLIASATSSLLVFER
ncbi:PaaI family thioesterase [Sphingomonas sp. ASV193]|uniref:PaaI family thioesterase n=1 Tax=Sphingomonas sp. ASV193 TaxID=3144405 RepID=UPI0032E8853E